MFEALLFPAARRVSGSVSRSWLRLTGKPAGQHSAACWAAGGAIAAAMLLTGPAQAQLIQGFDSPRFKTNANGNIRAFGNTVLTCDIRQPGCANAQQRTNLASGAPSDNNEFNMVYVDVDGAGNSTFNSSTATISLPAGSEVLWAGLYWGGDTSPGSGSVPPAPGAPNPEQRNRVLLQTPASGGYTAITAEDLFEFNSIDGSFNRGGLRYQGFQEITEQVRQGGSGRYTVANLQAGTGVVSGGLYGGWSIVVVFENADETFRNLTVFDGLADVQSSATGTALDVTVRGFSTPSQGEFNARVGAVAYEGDLGIQGDNFRLNGGDIFSLDNPVANFFNGFIFGPGAGQRSPDFSNNFGFDVAELILGEQANDVLGQDADRVRATFTTRGDTYFPGVLTFAIDTLRPDIAATKTVRDLDGSTVQPGDILEYEIVVANAGIDNARSVVLNDSEIPANTTYVPDSLEIVSGPGAGAQTDAVGDDLAEISADSRAITFRLGNGATAQAGGTLAAPSPDGSTPGESTTVRFRVRVDDNTPADTVLSNQAVVTFIGGSSTVDFSEQTDGDPNTPGKQSTTTVVGPGAEGLSLFKRITGLTRASGAQRRFAERTGDAPDSSIVGDVQIENITLAPGDEVEYSIYYRVTGDRVIRDVQLCDPLPAELVYVPGSLQLQRPGQALVALTDALDSDAAHVVSPLAPLSPPCPEVTNNSATVRANIGDAASAPDDVGFLRFRARVR